MGNTTEDRERRIAANLDTPNGKIFVEMVRIARGDSNALSGVSAAHDALGLPSSWMRERVAGRIRVKSGDLETLKRLVDIAKSNPYRPSQGSEPRQQRDPALNVELRQHRIAVRKMCRECIGADNDDEADRIGCPDGRCPLRAVSPVRMSNNPIEIPEVWE